jgi:tetratricopeptide (TPR) repeat protein
MSRRHDPFEELTLDQKAQINSICEQFEQALTSGCPARVEDQLAELVEPVRPVLLRELLLLECMDRLRRGDLVREESLLARFPGCADLIGDMLGEARRYAAAPPGTVISGMPPTGGDMESPRKLGRFVLKQLLNSGGFGTVYLAEDPERNGPVALKVPHLEILLTPSLRRRFVFEGEAASALEHPHLVQVIEASEVGALCYIASHYVPGTDLASWLRQRKGRGEPVPVNSAARLVATLADAMQHAHDRGVLHCDLKPGNVLLADGRELFPIITDFGLARLVGAPSELSQTGQLLGTPAYMAPEQAQGRRKDLTPRSDVWALGAILYELLAGAPPFAGNSPIEVLHKVVNEDTLSLRSRRREVPVDLEAICLHCLEKNPEQRYPSAAALADDLERWLRGEPVKARRIGWLGRGWRWCRRKPAIAGLLGTVLLAVASGFSTSLVLWRQSAANEARALAGEAQALANLKKEELARRETEASYEQINQLVHEIIQSSTLPPLSLDWERTVPDIQLLRKQEEHFARLLTKSPGDTSTRIALTTLRGSMATRYANRGHMVEMATCLQGARDLWETLARQSDSKPEHRDWLASTYHWQADAAHFQGQFEQSFRFRVRAYAISQELAEEQPGNMNLLSKVVFRSDGLIYRSGWAEDRGGLLRLLEEERAVLRKLISEGSVQTATRKRLALTCLLLGDCHRGTHRIREALPCWREAYKQYRILARQQPDDVLVNFHLGLCCSQLMAEQPSGPYRSEAQMFLEQSAKRLAALAQQFPGATWPQCMLLKTYCCLAVCYCKAGRPALAKQIIQERGRHLVAQVGTLGADWHQGAFLAWTLLTAADLLEKDMPVVALAVVRETAGLTERLAEALLRDPGFRKNLAEQSVNLSAYLCRLGDPERALRQAEQARRLYEGLHRGAPSTLPYAQGLGQAWERIAKAHWKLGRRDQALDAFREAGAAQRRVVEQMPTVPIFRMWLSRCYDRVAHYSALAGDRPGAALALLERKKLWPGNAEELMKVSADFQNLAKDMGKGGVSLSPPEQEERQRYLAEAERARGAAEAVRGDKP